MHQVKNPAPFLRVIREVEDYATLVLQTANYLQRELAYMPMSEAWRERLNTLCDELILTKHNVYDEIRGFEALPLSDHWEEECTNLSSSIVKAFVPTLEKMRQATQDLQLASGRDAKYQFTWILLAEGFAMLWQQHLPLENALVQLSA